MNLTFSTLGKIIDRVSIKHQNQYRRNGIPYFSHPMSVMSRIINLKHFDLVTLILAISHDVIEDTTETYETFDQYLKKLNVSETDRTEIIKGLQLLTKDPQLCKADQEAYFPYSVDLMDERSLMVKITDTLDNVSDIPKTAITNYKKAKKLFNKYCGYRILYQSKISKMDLSSEHPILNLFNELTTSLKIAEQSFLNLKATTTK